MSAQRDTGEHPLTGDNDLSNLRIDKVKDRIQSDPPLNLEVMRETTYYKRQSKALAKFLHILGLSLTCIFSIGAVIGAMITMYAAAANQGVEAQCRGVPATRG